MAEAAFRHTVQSNGYGDNFDVIDSCGTAAYHEGEGPDHRKFNRIQGYPEASETIRETGS